MRSACGLAQLQWSVMVGSLNWERNRQGCPGRPRLWGGSSSIATITPVISVVI